MEVSVLFIFSSGENKSKVVQSVTHQYSGHKDPCAMVKCTRYGHICKVFVNMCLLNGISFPLLNFCLPAGLKPKVHEFVSTG